MSSTASYKRGSNTIDEGIVRNLQFLLLEVRKQVEGTLKALDNPDDFTLDKISSSGDYVDNLRDRLLRSSYEKTMKVDPGKGSLINDMIAVNTISINLEKIGDYCENIVKQIKFFKDKSFIKRYDYSEYFKVIFDATDSIRESLLDRNIQLALNICKAEYRIDDIYEKDFKTIMSDIKAGALDHGDIITSLFIFRYLERIGDALLNMGEAIISSVVGTRIKIQHFNAIHDIFENDDNFLIESVGVETKSGCRIDKVKRRETDHDWHEAIFKEGRSAKLKEEKEKLELWASLFPGLTPRVVGYEEKLGNASLLMEYIAGRSFQEILLVDDEEFVLRALDKIAETITTVWKSTMKPGPRNAGFMGQLKKRIGDVYMIHQEFDEKAVSIGRLARDSFQELIEKAISVERELSAPFSVFIHGDFNNDNVLYDPVNGGVHFIDIHRSDYSDYVQDVVIFIVSNFRLPFFDDRTRDIINRASLEFYHRVSRFATSVGDDTFEARCSLGLARSFFTSTRFTFQKKPARLMFLRCLYLLESLIRHRGTPWKDYRLTTEIINY